MTLSPKTKIEFDDLRTFFQFTTVHVDQRSQIPFKLIKWIIFIQIFLFTRRNVLPLR